MYKKAILVGGITLVLVAGFVLFLQNKQRPQTSPEIKSSTKTRATQSPVLDEKYPQHIEAIAGSDEVWYNIPEYGVRMRLNKEFAEDLIYSIGQESFSGRLWETASFSAKTIVSIDSACSPDKDPAFGIVSKTKGNLEEDIKSGYVESERKYTFLQIGDSYLSVTTPHAPCWSPEFNKEFEELPSEKYYGNGFKNIFEGFKTIEAIQK